MELLELSVTISEMKISLDRLNRLHAVDKLQCIWKHSSGNCPSWRSEKKKILKK